MTETNNKSSETGLEIAVIGMAGRFPGAPDINRFWENIKNGVESVIFYSDEELLDAGISPEVLQNPNYVKADLFLEQKEYFDASFFGYSPREAEIMDPQLRLFHESSWAAMEDAGYDPGAYKGAIGVYAGSTNSFQWQALSMLSGKGEALGGLANALLHNSDLMSARISHRLNLRGPSFTLFTACSTSLVAIHLAGRALLTGECSMAIAGGVSVGTKQKTGYLYQEGMIFSPDGHCRSFDAEARGITYGEGVGAVVLRRLKDAAADRDNIHAVIKCSVINNDGLTKVDFTAPSVKGQASAISRAHKLARVSPECIGYVEAHGTGTVLGDPIEAAALIKGFETDKKGYCGLGSVKTNVGHLDTAAGVTSFIKTVLMLKHRLMPPSLHFETPNPGIHFEDSPFYVNTGLKEWTNGQSPLRAGVNSSGIGGTNAYLVLEEWTGTNGAVSNRPGAAAETGARRDYHLMLLSAKTSSALEQLTVNAAEHLKANRRLDPADVAFTLQVGRKAFQHRKMLVCSNLDEAVDLLSTPGSRKVRISCIDTEDPRLVFLFSGLGGQYRDMGRELYQKEPVFRKELDACFELLEPLTGCDIKSILYPRGTDEINSESSMSSVANSPAGESSDIHRIEIVQVIVFILEYALAKMLMHWGVTPGVMIGYSFGEYAAACLSGVFSLEDALKLVVARGKLMEQLPEGAMLSIPLPVKQVEPLLEKELSIAVDNGASCIVSGNVKAVSDFESRMKNDKYMCMPLQSTRAVHSAMMEPILAEFTGKIEQLTLNEPQIPFISNVTGTWIKADEAVSPAYWAKHLRQTVQFAAGIGELTGEPGSIFVEIGPGHDISTMIKSFIPDSGGHKVLNLVRAQQQDIVDQSFLLNQLGRLWLWGIKIDWQAFHAEEKRYRVSLPTYPFEGQRFWIDGEAVSARLGKWGQLSADARKPNMADWFYIPVWTQGIPGRTDTDVQEEQLNWLIFTTGTGIALELGRRLQQLQPQPQTVVYVRTGTDFIKENEYEYVIDPLQPQCYDDLFADLTAHNRLPRRIVHAWNITPVDEAGIDLDAFDYSQDTGFYSLLNIAGAIGRQSIRENIRLTVVTSGMYDVMGGEPVNPGKATLLGAVKVIPLEYANITCKAIDIALPGPGQEETARVTGLVLAECLSDSPEFSVAFRGMRRWVQDFKPLRLDKEVDIPRRLKQKGVYLVTGGLGGIGFTLAQYLARAVKARVILIHYSPFPSDSRWDEYLESHGDDNDNEVCVKIRKIRELEENGAEFLLMQADVADPTQMETAIEQATRRFGPIDGIIHTAAQIDYDGVIQRRNMEATGENIAPKVKGTLVIEQLLKDTKPDFLVLFSSIGNVFYKDKFGQVGFIASNEFVQSFAHYMNSREGIFTVTINWCDWWETGMVVKALDKKYNGDTDKVNSDLQALSVYAVSNEQGVEIFCRILEESLPQILVSPQDVGLMIEAMDRAANYDAGADETAGPVNPPQTLYKRPELSSEYVAPRGVTEKKLASIFQLFFAIEEVGIKDDFFELGGNSLVAINVLAYIQKELEVELPLVELFNHPTIEGIARLVNSAEKTAVSEIRPVEEKSFYKLSSAQKRLFIMQQMDTGSTGYNQPHVVLLEGDIETARLENALRKMVERHEILRTTFDMIADEPVQLVHGSALIECSVTWGEVEKEEADRIVKDFVKPFDLMQLPLFRLTFLKLSDRKNSYVLMLDIHHIISDGVSNNIFVKELADFYNGKEPGPLHLQYKDFAHWHNNLLDSGQMAKQEAYWLNVFEGEIPVLQLPTDYERPAMQSFEGEILSFYIDADETKALNAVARKEGATLFMVVLAVYSILLAKISGQKDIVIGTPSAGRGHMELNNLIGMFVNTVPLRTFPEDDKTFIQFLGEIREHTLMAFQHQDYQFDDLVDAVVTQRDLSRNPIFDAMFVFQNIGNPKIEAGTPGQESPSFTVKHYEFESKTARFDLNLQGFVDPDVLSFTLEYCTKLFKSERIEWFIRYFKDIVAAVLDNPDKKLADISILYEEEKKEILSQFADDLRTEM
jgi:acyl transferase domain-containing protein/acyl carrier protein